MWKWILVGAGVVIGVGIMVVIILAISNPQGFAEFFFSISDEFDVTVDGESHTVKIDRFEGGMTVQERTYLLKKMLALLAMARKDDAHSDAWKSYSRAFYEMAQDHTLSAEEYRMLLDLHGDLVSDEDVNNWMQKFEDLDEHELEAMEEVLGD